jgi:hypothetical protein
MKLYKNSNGVWAGTQADARKMCGKTYSTVDVPVNKAGLLQFLNLHQVASYTSNGKEGTITGEIDTSNKSAMSWIRWSHDCMCRGQIQQAKEMLRKGLELASDHSKQDGG